MKLKIGTHNSGTGEKPGNFLSWLLSPFAKCQSKTLIEQYKAGCRLFDLRVKKVNDKYILAHGIWKSNKTLEEAIKDIKKAYYLITYEGKLDNEDEFIQYAKQFPNVIQINVKKPIWKVLYQVQDIPFEGAFKNLDGSTWHTYLPIPYLWKMIYFRKNTFNQTIFKLVDFL